jgi:hypothetical protein
MLETSPGFGASSVVVQLQLLDRGCYVTSIECVLLIGITSHVKSTTFWTKSRQEIDTGGAATGRVATSHFHRARGT